MLKQVRSNAINVDPFTNRNQITPNVNQRHKINQLTHINLFSDKTADTLTSSITTLFHPHVSNVSEFKSFNAYPSTLNNYLDKYFNPYRRFSEKQNRQKSPSPLITNNSQFKLSNEIESFRDSIQAIDHDQISTSQPRTSNINPQTKKSKVRYNSLIQLISQKNNQEKNKFNLNYKIQNKILIKIIQQQNNFQSSQNQNNINHIKNQEKKKLISNQNDQKSFIPIKSDEKGQTQDLIIQKQDPKELIEYNVKQFRIQINKTILLNQTQQENPEIIQYQIPEIHQEITLPKIINQQQQELEDPNFKRTKSEILRPQKAQQKFSNLKLKLNGFQIKFLIAILIVILLIKFYTPLV
ncbi:unnamed protein product [Paramecium sonneborni]|uniref:Transmembrane protein n=1 Tax=Paramecium sonneborni TaxID=65129 RepID=A0A8S1ND02_9CILI|nr:unnamed protein product [Paramecium sonneborni]